MCRGRVSRRRSRKPQSARFAPFQSRLALSEQSSAAPTAGHHLGRVSSAELQSTTWSSAGAAHHPACRSGLRRQGRSVNVTNSTRWGGSGSGQRLPIEGHAVSEPGTGSGGRGHPRLARSGSPAWGGAAGARRPTVPTYCRVVEGAEMTALTVEVRFGRWRAQRSRPAAAAAEEGADPDRRRGDCYIAAGEPEAQDRAAAQPGRCRGAGRELLGACCSVCCSSFRCWGWRSAPGWGALAGSLADVGIDDDFIRTVRGEVQEGTSALFVMSGIVPDRVLGNFRGTGAHLVSSNLIATAKTV
ncbi:uncharacterized protein DUF1269 [Pseudonocardia hierapolitana]|uniref:Uncharacterized protein DUF1269 n=1 Tax=Pseudonocardia hierapolitana TaxID=1128676 RepID=A0A561SH27_9PSEU|nr:uncharacterized protein DUF1269 [Pseudonocardia hierapolitana]